MGMLLRIGMSTGGVDIVACMVQKNRPYLNVERIIAVISYAIIFISYAVYRQLDSILLSVVQMFVYERVAAAFMKDSRNAVEFKIVTKHPEEIRGEILYNLKHGATVVESKGMFTESDSAVIFSVVNLRQIPEFLNILKNIRIRSYTTPKWRGYRATSAAGRTKRRNKFNQPPVRAAETGLYCRRK